MNKQTFLLLCILTAMNCFGQTKYEPQILIISPNEVKFEKKLDKEISDYNKEIKKSLKQKNAEETPTDEMSENIKTMLKNETTYKKALDFFKQPSFFSEQYLAYRFFESFPNLMIIIKDIKSKGEISELKKISNEHHLQYVLNFPKINFYQQSGINYAKITVQLYDQNSNTILIDKDYVGDWTNHGFEFACNDSSLDCTINNALSQALLDVVSVIATNSPTLRQQRDIAQQRFNALVTNYYAKPFDKSLLTKIILTTDSNININSVYQCLTDNSKTKFVAFFLERSSPQDFKLFKDNKKDKNVNIISSKEIKDSDFLDNVPQTYAYIVKGVKYKDKWYYQKESVTYFEANDLEEGRQKYFNNLQRWNFFKDNSTEFNSDFWETNLFSKVESSVLKNKDEIEIRKALQDKAKTKEDKEIYQSMIDDYYEKDLKNQEYFGLYEIVADEIKNEKRLQDELSVDKIKNKILPDFFNDYCKKNKLDGYIKMNGTEIPLIFPKDKSVLISPILLNYGNEKKELNYFVLVPNKNGDYDIYRWNYFEPIKTQYGSMFGQEVNKQLNQITKWNFSFDTLDDTSFWDKYVLVKSGDTYKYLIQTK